MSRSSGSSLGSFRLKLCLGKEKAGASKRLKKFFEIVSTGFHVLSKIHVAKQLEHQKLPQPGKDQCLPSAMHGGQGVPKGFSRPRRCMHVAHCCAIGLSFLCHWFIILVPLVYHLHVLWCIRKLSIMDGIGNLGEKEGLSSLSTRVN
jgi:hypothetical protein